MKRVVDYPLTQARNAQTRMKYPQRPIRRPPKNPAMMSKAPFRKCEVPINRKLDFDLDRELPFRMKGVIFRKEGVVFRKKGVVFRVGSIDLKYKSQQRGKWEDHSRWQRTAYKQETTYKTSKLKTQKSSAVSSKQRTFTTLPSQTPPAQKRQVTRVVTPLRDDLPYDPSLVPRIDNSKKMAVDLNNIGVKHYNNGNYSTALNFFTEAIRHDPYLDVARRNQQVCYGLTRRGQ